MDLASLCAFLGCEHVKSRPEFCPDHLSPTGSQTLASWTQMAKPLVTLVPQATQAAAVRGKGELTGAMGRRQDAPAGV